jgi:hydroxymethylglutaryl-CoA lyase
MAVLDRLPREVCIYEVSARDGLQSESVTVPTTRKVRLIESLVRAGVTRIEASSFVSPKWIPQLADAEQVAGLLPAGEGVRFSALCPNARGLERARQTRIRELAVFVSASETHNLKNVNDTIEGTLARLREVIAPAVAEGMRVRGYVSTLWGCPYEGRVDPAVGLRLSHALLTEGCEEVSLGDTLGVGTPCQTRDILTLFLSEIPAERIALHMHDTRGTALANILVALEMGIRVFDASVAGLGGCPYAPGAAGNVATEDLVYMLHGMGVPTGIDLERLWEAGKVAEAVVGRELPGRVHRAGIRALRG